MIQLSCRCIFRRNRILHKTSHRCSIQIIHSRHSDHSVTCQESTLQWDKICLLSSSRKANRRFGNKVTTFLPPARVSSRKLRSQKTFLTKTIRTNRKASRPKTVKLHAKITKVCTYSITLSLYKLHRLQPKNNERLALFTFIVFTYTFYAFFKALTRHSCASVICIVIRYKLAAFFSSYFSTLIILLLFFSKQIFFDKRQLNSFVSFTHRFRLAIRNASECLA